MTTARGTIWLIAAVLAAGCLPAAAQPAHVQRLAEAAAECFQAPVAGIEAFDLDADVRAPYLKSLLSERWIREGRRVFVADSSTVSAGRPLLSYRVDGARIEYRRLNGPQAERTASVAIRYRLTGPDRQILAESLCEKRRIDTVDVDRIEGLVDARYTETDVRLETKSLFRKVLEPAVIVGAAVVGTYLFFNLRSKRGSDG